MLNSSSASSKISFCVSSNSLLNLIDSSSKISLFTLNPIDSIEDKTVSKGSSISYISLSIFSSSIFFFRTKVNSFINEIPTRSSSPSFTLGNFER